MLVAALFTAAKVWKQPRCASADGWTKKMWGVCVYVCVYVCVCVCINCNGILALVKKKIPPFAKKWMDLKDIMSN